MCLERTFWAYPYLQRNSKQYCYKSTLLSSEIPEVLSEIIVVFCAMLRPIPLFLLLFFSSLLGIVLFTLLVLLP